MAKYTKQIQEWMRKSEGGYVNHLKDPGGATNFGVTKRTLANWRGVKLKDMDTKEVVQLSIDEAGRILKRNYWDVAHCDDLPVGLDYATYDYSVNSGPGRAIKDLQRTLGITVDGIVGGQTLSAIEARDIPALIEAYCNRRWRYLQALRTFETFGDGWKIRVMGKELGVQDGDIGVIDRAIMLANGEKDIPAPIIETPYKAEPEKENPWNKPEVLGMIGSALAAVFSAVSSAPIIQYALAASVVAACVVAVIYAVKRINAMDPA